MSLDIKAAREVQQIAAEQLKMHPSVYEVRLAVKILSIVLDELESREKTMDELRATMTY